MNVILAIATGLLVCVMSALIVSIQDLQKKVEELEGRE